MPFEWPLLRQQGRDKFALAVQSQRARLAKTEPHRDGITYSPEPAATRQ